MLKVERKFNRVTENKYGVLENQQKLKTVKNYWPHEKKNENDDWLNINLGTATSVGPEIQVQAATFWRFWRKPKQQEAIEQWHLWRLPLDKNVRPNLSDDSKTINASKYGNGNRHETRNWKRYQFVVNMVDESIKTRLLLRQLWKCLLILVKIESVKVTT